MDPAIVDPDAPTLAELVADQVGLEVWCCRIGCHHHVTIPPAIAVYLFGPHTRIALAANRLRCSICGARGREDQVKTRADVLDTGRVAAAAHWARPENGLPAPPASYLPMTPAADSPSAAIGARIER